ncbi:ABC transporter ATP-binding protein [Ciceribacter sp. L1K22]|uniref:ABC transporter ATP-binding protein n=1 Tax=Ciceribacter sp. L1K22 TaxID=2820275 RepID=UPI001ABE6C2E|nr:ABC transporter ATP-binding protein [Ciceribacter sp. L1K22]
MLEVKGLSVAYGQHRALENVSLKVGRGEIVVILGANGAGKSTLLKAVSGICEGKVAGTVTMQGADILGLAANRIVDEGIALVPEGRGVFGDLTVAENLRLGAHAMRAREDEAGNLDRLLRLFPKLHERRNQVVRTMSGGEQQMVAIGRAMMSSPALLMLDEPSLGLSPLLCKELFLALKNVRDMGIGILLVEQNARQSLAIADRGYLLENGHIIHEGRAQDLRNDPAVQAAYLGGGVAAATRKEEQLVATPVAVASPLQRTSEPTPDRIAAAALAAVQKQSQPSAIAPPPPKRASETTTTVPPPPPLAASRTPQPAPSPSPAMRGTADALLNGVSISDLVAEASRKSRAEHGHAVPTTPARVATYRTAPTPYTGGSPALDAGGASDDRLKAVLKEIEEAAAHARAWRSGANRN